MLFRANPIEPITNNLKFYIPLLFAILVGLVLSASVGNKSGGDFVCDMCKKAVTELKNNTQALHDILKQLCAYNQVSEAECDKKIEEITKLINEKSPEELCKLFGVCKASKSCQGKPQ